MYYNCLSKVGGPVIIKDDFRLKVLISHPLILILNIFKISIPHSYFKFQGVELLSKAQHKVLANFYKKKMFDF